MKNFSFILLLCAITLFSCTGKKKDATQQREEAIAEFRSHLTEADTTAMLKICDDAMEMLKQKKYDVVLASLYEYNDSTKEVKPLSDTTAKKYKRRFEMFPVLSYYRIYYSFQLEGCNDVKYRVTFATAEAAQTKDDPTTAYMFNPVKVDGSWKLCVKTARDEFDHSRR